MYFWLGGGGLCCVLDIISLPCIAEIMLLVMLGYAWISLRAGSPIMASEACCGERGWPLHDFSRLSQLESLRAGYARRRKQFLKQPWQL